MNKINVAVLISGNGSNLQALIDACARDNFSAQIVLVISNKADAYGLQRAKEANIKTSVIDHKDYSNREVFDQQMHKILEASGVELVCLAGFMRLLSKEFTDKWQNKMINIHPSLLPLFKGADAHRDVLASGAEESGCTVHYVTAEMDSGPIILQKSVPVFTDDTRDSLAARVLEQEHLTYPKALELVVSEIISSA